MRRWLTLTVLAISVAGCGWFSREDPATQPAELTDFQATHNFRKEWSRDVGAGGDELARKLAPIVDDGRVYVSDNEGRVTAYDAESGRAQWRTETDLRASGGPGVEAGTLVLGGLDGEVVALDADTGTEKWRAPVSSEVLSVPAVSRNRTVVRCIDGRVFGFDTDTGRRDWIYDHSVPLLSLRGAGDPLLRAGQVILGLDNGQVISLNAEDGSVIWEQPIAVPEGRTELERVIDVDGQVAVAATEVYAASYQGHLAALSLQSGQQIWSKEMSSWQGVAVRRTELFLSDAAGSVWAFDRRNGASLWKQEALTNRNLTTPAVLSGSVLVGDLEGYLHALDTQDGSFQARTQVDGAPIDVVPHVSDGRVYVLSRDGELAAYRLVPRG